MTFVADLLAGLLAGLLALLATEWYNRSPATPARPAQETARAVGEAVRTHRRLRRLLAQRLDRSVAAGFLLTLAAAGTVVGGVVLGVLAYLVRNVAAVQRVDNSVAAWSYDHRSSLATSALKAVTDLGSIQIVAGLALLVVAVDFYRTRSRWPFVFLLTVLLGVDVITLSVKDLVDRVRPTLNPAADSLGLSFPSGHSATAAAFYAAVALVVGRGLSRRSRQAAIALAVAIAVAVAGSRVLLDLHWLSDVIGGLALGWGWFALCAVIFGGRLLRPTAAVDASRLRESRAPSP